MLLYEICIVLHLLALSLWLGHMFVWSLFVGPAMKRIEPTATAEFVRERSLFMGGLGWPALVILVITGGYMLTFRGYGLDQLLTGEVLAMPGGSALVVKLLLVLLMIGYQATFGHRRAPVAIYINMLCAMIILGASLMLTSNWLPRG